jgi:hypothetical protein
LALLDCLSAIRAGLANFARSARIARFWPICDILLMGGEHKPFFAVHPMNGV